MNEFKIRASAASQIVGGHIGLSPAQNKEHIKLTDKLASGKPLTDLQGKALQDLTNKIANPEAPQGLKTYCENWYKEQLYQRRKEFSSKYTAKGNEVEDASINYIAEQLGYGMLIKNEKHFTNDFLKGTPDVILKNHIIDVKNSWDWSTFPLLETKVEPAYYWQAQAYLDLVGRDSYKLIYVLSDTPADLIQKEAYYYARNNGFEELTDEIYQYFVEKMTYPDVDDSLKIRVFEIKRNENDIKKLYSRVKTCREYINDLPCYLAANALP